MGANGRVWKGRVWTRMVEYGMVLNVLECSVWVWKGIQIKWKGMEGYKNERGGNGRAWKGRIV